MNDVLVRFCKMVIMVKRWRGSRQSAVILFAIFALCLSQPRLDLQDTRRNIEKQLEEGLKLDKGKGCVIPSVDPFSSEATRFDKEPPSLDCKAMTDWVKCNYSRCRVIEEIKKYIKDIECYFEDIIYHSDFHYTIGPPKFLREEESYKLNKSDHVKVSCTGTTLEGDTEYWSGNTLGFRKVEPKKPPSGRENTFNVLIFCFDSTARNGFIRRMPKSWKVLIEDLGAIVMEGYNVVGEATTPAIFPILTGYTELELPESRKVRPYSNNVDIFPFIFYKLKEDGYRTAYFEDMPEVGSFQFRLNGWLRQPADHYLRAFLLEHRNTGTSEEHCVGSTPQFKLMMDITEQFMRLDGKRFAFTFISDITHDDFNLVQTADEDTAAFLRNFTTHTEDTLLVVMGDHGSRDSEEKRKTLQGKFEERQPLMALRLPEALVRARPAALAALQANARALSTPHDLHATLLDVLGMTQHWNPYRVPGADLPRALTMLDPIPRSRSCSEAGIELHWCACVALQNVSSADPLYNETAHVLLSFINKLVSGKRSLCSPKTLQSIKWVRREQPQTQMLAYKQHFDSDGYTSYFGSKTDIPEDKYRVKIVVGPGREEYEALMTYVVKRKKFLIKPEDILRTNAANISVLLPVLTLSDWAELRTSPRTKVTRTKHHARGVDATKKHRA